MQPLNDEQRKLAEKYLKQYGDKQIRKCIYAIYPKNLAHERMDDYISVGYEAVCKAARNFKPDKGTQFSTFVEMNVKSALRSDLRNRNRLKRKANERCDGLHRPLRRIEDKTVTLLDSLEDMSIKEREMRADLTGVNLYLKVLSPLQLRIIIMLLMGANRDMICSTLNMTIGTYDLNINKMLRRSSLKQEDGRYGKVKEHGYKDREEDY